MRDMPPPRRLSLTLIRNLKPNAPTLRRLPAAALTAAAGFLLNSAGCPPVTPTPPDDSGLPFLDQDGNFTFDKATPVALQRSSIAFRGQVSGSDDLDLYNIGELKAGDGITVDVQSDGGDLDCVLALLDSRQQLIAFNDDRIPDGSDLNPRLSITLPGGQSGFFIGVTSFPGSTGTGKYTITIDVSPDGDTPSGTPQVVYLDFRGGEGIEVPNVGTFTLKPLDASDFGSGFAGKTAAIASAMAAEVRDAYAGLNLSVITSDERDTPPSGDHSTVFFGGFDERAFAISESIDTFNADKNDRAIVFTESFGGRAFSKTPTQDELVQALGNTVAHEIGHLLGLVHTADCADLMDSTCGNNRILEPQAFKNGVLDPMVFPVGSQDSDERLAWILGASDTARGKPSARSLAAGAAAPAARSALEPPRCACRKHAGHAHVAVAPTH
ncbi:hypothetical protein RAS1_24190 [Phycisphaerae bacterium RAS1]|nr:hypothetical protein RAS1_24190 [Phycisphaerae bacterium RAS1]